MQLHISILQSCVASQRRAIFGRVKTAIIIFGVVLITLVLGGIAFFVRYLFDRRRTTKIRAIATQCGAEFASVMSKGKLLARSHGIPNRKLYNVIIRKEHGCTILFFDYPSGKYGASRVVTVSEVLRLPPFTITPRGKVALTLQSEVKLPHSPTFSSAVKIHSNYGNEVRQFLTPVVADHLAKCGGFWLDAQDNAFYSGIVIGGYASTKSIRGIMDLHAYVHWALCHGSRPVSGR